MKRKSANKISVEKLSTFLDGNATAHEIQEIFNTIPEDAELRELFHISQLVDKELGLIDCETFPITAMAATSKEGNYCCIECEKYIIRKFKVNIDEHELFTNAIKNGWQKDKGTALYNVGRNLENYGFIVTRQYDSNIRDIVNALNDNKSVIVAIDGGELLGNTNDEFKEDIIIGQIPDHLVVILSCDFINNTITIFDPNSIKKEDTYTLAQFENAWNDSKNYLVTITYKNTKTYIPRPIDLSDVKLNKELLELRETIAENAHEIWAQNRLSEGWTYGPQRNDKLRQTPNMVPYSQLPDSEKKYDREMAMKTIKLLKKLGYDLIKRNETELYQVLKQRIENSDHEFHCARCGNVIYSHQQFCDKCGFNLKMRWIDNKT